MHQEPLRPLFSPSAATWQETAKVPSSFTMADAQLGRELNPTVFTAIDPRPSLSEPFGLTGRVEFKLRRNFDETYDLGTTNHFSSH